MRTKLNVEAASLTMILADGPHRSPGTELTARHADEVGKPCIRIDLRDSKRIATALEGLAVPHRPRLILNVAGPRDSEQSGIEKPAKEFLSELFREIVARRPTEWPADQRKPKPIVED